MPSAGERPFSCKVDGKREPESKRWPVSKGQPCQHRHRFQRSATGPILPIINPPVLTFPLPLAHHQNLHNPLRRMPIPLFRDPPGPARPVQDGLGRRQDFFFVIADQDVGAFFAGDGAFGVMAQGDAEDAEDGGFFLQAAAVGKHQSGGHVEMEEFQVAEGIPQPVMNRIISWASPCLPSTILTSSYLKGIFFIP